MFWGILYCYPIHIKVLHGSRNTQPKQKILYEVNLKPDPNQTEKKLLIRNLTHTRQHNFHKPENQLEPNTLQHEIDLKLEMKGK